MYPTMSHAFQNIGKKTLLHCLYEVVWTSEGLYFLYIVLLYCNIIYMAEFKKQQVQRNWIWNINAKMEDGLLYIV